MWQYLARLTSRLETSFLNKPFRKPTNLSIDSELLEEAKAMDVNLSRAVQLPSGC